MLFKKDKMTKSNTKGEQMAKKEGATLKNSTSSPLLERYLQKDMTDHMREVDDEALARAIQTLLYEDKDKKNKHWN